LIHRVLKRLFERNILIGMSAQIDFACLGLAEYGINLALAAQSDRAREDFISQLSKEPSVGWVAEVGADLDYMFNVIAPNPHQVAAMLARLNNRNRISILRKELCIRTRRMRFERGIFGAEGKRKGHFLLGLRPEPQHIDQLDKQILSVISISNRSSFRELARSLSVSSSTFARRLEILRQKKIVLGFSWQMQLASCGVLQYRLLVSLRDNTPALREAIMTIVQSTPYVKMFADCIGAWDYEMELDVWDARQVKPVVAALSEACYGQLEKITVVPLFLHRKFSSFPVESR
jgi:DNA-binding Lrp family transcriptional regulator